MFIDEDIAALEEEREERRKQAIAADQARVDRRKAVLRAVRIEKRLKVEKDPVAIVALCKMMEKIPQDILDDADALLATKPRATKEHAPRPKAQGDTLVLKVSIAGSGYDKWNTAVSKGPDGEELDWERADNKADDEQATSYEREGGEGPELSFSGPGGQHTKASPLGGVSDSGSNSIEHLVEQVPKAIEAELAEDKEITGKERPILILLKAHSRGAVAASQVSKAIKEKYGERVTIELVLVDPVPGPGHSGAALNIDLGDIDDFTLVYSTASGYGVGFTPQTVMNAKRIIVSRQNHSVGLANGFRWQGKIYRGSKLNDLDPGVYVDMNADGQNTAELIHVTDIGTAKTEIQEAFKKNSSWTRDYDRMSIIEKVLKNYYAKAGGQ